MKTVKYKNSDGEFEGLYKVYSVPKDKELKIKITQQGENDEVILTLNQDQYAFSNEEINIVKNWYDLLPVTVISYFDSDSDTIDVTPTWELGGIVQTSSHEIDCKQMVLNRYLNNGQLDILRPYNYTISKTCIIVSYLSDEEYSTLYKYFTTNLPITITKVE